MSNCILVIGAGGFVGQHLLSALAQDNENIIAVYRRPLSIEIKGVESVVGDLNTPEQLLPLIRRSKTVIHLAARTTPGTSSGNAIAELRENLLPLLGLLEAMQRKPDTKLVYLSSGGSLYSDANEYASAETAVVQPRSYHGAGKVASEHFISAWCSQFGGSATILRPSNLYGPGQIERAGFGIIPTGFGKIARGETLTIWGDGSAVRDYLYIDDFMGLCSAVLAEPMQTGARVFNASSGVGVDLNDLLMIMEMVAGKKLARNYVENRVVNSSRVIIDPTQASLRYNWKSTTSLTEGLTRTWEWLNTIRH